MSESTVSGAFVPPTPIRQKAEKLRIVAYGEPGVGKTTFGLTFPHPLIVDTEGSLEGDAIVDVTGDEWSPVEYRDLDALYNWIKKNRDEKGYETLVIDTIDALIDWLLTESVDTVSGRRKEIEERNLHEMLVPEQRDYLAVQKGLDRFLTKLRMLNMHVVLLAHVRNPDDPADGKVVKVKKRQAAGPPSAEAIMEKWSSIYGEFLVVRPAARAGSKTKPEPYRALIVEPGLPTRKCKTRYRALGGAVKEPTFDKMWAAIQSSRGDAEKEQSSE